MLLNGTTSTKVLAEYRNSHCSACVPGLTSDNLVNGSQLWLIHVSDARKARSDPASVNT